MTNVKKTEKKESFVRKNAKIYVVEMLKNIPLNLETIMVTYCHNLQEVPRLLRLEKSENGQKI